MKARRVKGQGKGGPDDGDPKGERGGRKVPAKEWKYVYFLNGPGPSLTGPQSLAQRMRYIYILPHPASA
jgi:hypothetical protein